VVSVIANPQFPKVVGEIPQCFHGLRLTGDIEVMVDHRQSAMLVSDVSEAIGS
jgi:hypothetical protein